MKPVYNKTTRLAEISGISPFEIVKRYANKPGTIWLDSTLTFGDRGKMSFIGLNPVARISQMGNGIAIKSQRNDLTILNSGNIFDIVENCVTTSNLTAVGYISYEAMYPGLELTPKVKPEIPEISFYFYDDILRYSHVTDSFENENLIADFVDVPSGIYDPKFETRPRLVDAQPKAYYIKNVKKIQEHIKEGDIYQANYTTRFNVVSQEDPFSVYRNLRDLNPAPYGAYLNYGDFHILSSSPERMFKKDNNKISSSPIKGTIELGQTEDEQKRNLQTLVESAKDKAELLMIVDLIRNDLGRISKKGSVHVDAIYKPEIYSSLIHLVSDISSELEADVTFPDIAQSLFPGGSITGTPKRRAVEILSELEHLPRSVYTGCIGYIDKDSADFNIAIRTMYHKKSHYYIHAGGGIIADSDPESEYHEMMLKAKNLLRAVGIDD
ncbi:MAG: anthranilate synthase component I family protein [Calditrichaeota bacterium]|nr:MAG: anthranilate synthase component I family protein [Calditrichota bacterium]